LTIVGVTGTTTGIQWEATYRNKKTKERQQKARERKQQLQQSAVGLEGSSRMTEAGATA
jgi:hypothetical protein